MTIDEYYVGSKRYYKVRFWYYINNKRKSKCKQGFELKKVAERWADDEKRRLEGLTENADRMRVKEFLYKWIDTKEEKLAPSTLRGYKVNIRHCESIFDYLLPHLKIIHIQNLADELSRKGLRYNSVKYVLRMLHSAFQYAIRNDFMKVNPVDRIEIKPDEKPFEATVYSEKDLGDLIMLLREQHHWLYIPVLLASFRGLRKGECLSLEISNIDFENNKAHIKNTYQIVNREKIHKKVKTKASDSTIDISGFLAEELRAAIGRMKASGRIPQYISEVDGKLPDPSHISRAIKQFQEANKLPLCRFHDLRHTFAVVQLEAGTDLDTLKRLLRHSKIGITSDYYLHNNITLIRKASAVMDNVVKIKCAKSVTKEEKKG
jgi:integrase